MPRSSNSIARRLTQRSVIADKNENYVQTVIFDTTKHPLNSTWSLWYYLPDESKGWEANQHRIHTVEYIEDFWSFFNHLKPPTELTNGVDYSFFKNGIRPMWEASENIEGGRLTIVNTSKLRHVNIDEMWMDVLLFLIGETFPHSDAVCGAVLNVRKYGFKIAIWTANQDQSEITLVGRAMKRFSPALIQPITFEAHEQTQKNSKKFGKASSTTLFSI